MGRYSLFHSSLNGHKALFQSKGADKDFYPLFYEADKSGKGFLDVEQVQAVVQDMAMAPVDILYVSNIMKSMGSSEKCSKEMFADVVVELMRINTFLQSLKWDFAMLDSQGRGSITEQQAQFLLHVDEHFSEQIWKRYTLRRQFPGSKISFAEIEDFLTNISYYKSLDDIEVVMVEQAEVEKKEGSFDPTLDYEEEKERLFSEFQQQMTEIEEMKIFENEKNKLDAEDTIAQRRQSAQSYKTSPGEGGLHRKRSSVSFAVQDTYLEPETDTNKLSEGSALHASIKEDFGGEEVLSEYQKRKAMLDEKSSNETEKRREAIQQRLQMRKEAIDGRQQMFDSKLGEKDRGVHKTQEGIERQKQLIAEKIAQRKQRVKDQKSVENLDKAGDGEDDSGDELDPRDATLTGIESELPQTAAGTGKPIDPNTYLEQVKKYEAERVNVQSREREQRSAALASRLDERREAAQRQEQVVGDMLQKAEGAKNAMNDDIARQREKIQERLNKRKEKAGQAE
eukprot:Nk52_evm27s270 gene=Nk52_evmTU27s270